MDPEERNAIEATLRRFAGRIDEVLFAVEGPDGDLARVPQLLAEAREMDLVADPASDAPGYELGVWGRHCLVEGPALSLLTLSLLAEACAGFATAVHASGLACLALDGLVHFPAGSPLAAVFMPHYGLPLSPRAQAEGSGLRLETAPSGFRLEGASYFSLAADLPRALICFAQGPGAGGYQREWICLALSAGSDGTELVEVASRAGLRAVRQFHVHCDGVVVSPGQILCAGEAARRLLARVLACDWLGQAAIALGAARRALRDSRAYTAERYQGGRLIEGHASIQLLQGTAEYDLALLAAILDHHAHEPLSTMAPDSLLRWAIAVRLAVVEHAHRAVSNCLQTLGGYGYTEEYGFEKRLRDLSVLKSLHGAPDQLKLTLRELSRDG